MTALEDARGTRARVAGRLASVRFGKSLTREMDADMITLKEAGATIDTLISEHEQLTSIVNEIRPLMALRGADAHDAPSKIHPLLERLLELVDPASTVETATTNPATVHRTIDLTTTSWGHNISWINWDAATGKGTAHVWLTPGPRVGDTLIVPSQQGTMPLRVTKTESTLTVDDMFKVHLERAEPADPQA